MTLPAKPPLHVLKFGSSVLRDVEDLAVVAGEIYRQRRGGAQVIAVVSALAGETDRLFAEAQLAGGGVGTSGIADLVSLGEERSAALLALACDRIGLTARICRPEDLGVLTEGEPLSAHPVSLDRREVGARLAETGLLIVPGFVGVDAAGKRTLLGRGGSDFSAIYLGGELGAKFVRLYKDVDGVFDRDPAKDAGARRYEQISWTDALKVARPLVQPQAVEYAALRRLPIEVAPIGALQVSRIGAVTAPPVAHVPLRRARIGLAGFGTVGQALAERLRAEPRFDLGPILVRDVEKPRHIIAPAALTAKPEELIASEPDIVVDAMSCEAAGAALCGTLLARGIDVATASKRLVSASGARLSEACSEGAARLAYSAAVGGGATVLETIDRVRAAGEIIAIDATLNGTTNFILGQLAAGQSLGDALAEAQRAGFAEENSDFDLSGADAAAKLQIIAHHAFGTAPGTLAVATEWLDEDAAARIAASGERWVQLAHVERGEEGLQASVRLVPRAQVPELPFGPNEWNGVHIRLADGSTAECLGRGAGGAATAEAIVADLYDLIAARMSNARADDIVLEAVPA